jgi:mRNA interferase HigB
MARIVTEKHIYDFMHKHPQYSGSLRAWVTIVRDRMTVWEKPQDIVLTFGPKAVDMIGEDRVVIDVKGNNIRIIAKYQFPSARLYLKWIGTHAEYNKLCKKGLQYTVDMFN